MEIDQLKTPLHKAVESGNIKAVLDLIQKGAKIDSPSIFEFHSKTNWCFSSWILSGQEPSALAAS